MLQAKLGQEYDYKSEGFLWKVSLPGPPMVVWPKLCAGRKNLYEDFQIPLGLKTNCAATNYIHML